MWVMLGPVGLIRLCDRIWIFKKISKSAVTSVKGGPMLKVKASPVKNSQKPQSTLKQRVQEDIPYRLSSGGTNAAQGKRDFEMKSIISYSDKTHSGVRVRGSIYLADVICPVSLGSGGASTFAQCRTFNIEYLHPNMISSKIAKLARAFKHYRFTQVKLEYQSACPTSQGGEILLAVTQDVTTDPSPLADRKLRAWYDSIENSASMPIYGSQFGGQQMPWIKLTAEKAWYEISQNAMDVTDAYQSKLYIGLADTLVNFFGEIRLDFELLLVDQEETVFDILNEFSSGTVAPNMTLAIPALSAGNDVQWTQTGSSVSKFPPGLYSVFDFQDISPSINMGWSKGLITCGVEFILAITGYPGIGSVIMTLYDTLADFASDNPTEVGPAGGTSSISLTWIANALLFDSNSTGAPPSSSYVARRGTLDRHPTWRALQELWCSQNPGYAVGKAGIYPLPIKSEVVHDNHGPTCPTSVVGESCYVQDRSSLQSIDPTIDDKMEDQREVPEGGPYSQYGTEEEDDGFRIERIRQYLSRLNYKY
jgi:hypothetical protein